MTPSTQPLLQRSHKLLIRNRNSSLSFLLHLLLRNTPITPSQPLKFTHDATLSLIEHVHAQCLKHLAPSWIGTLGEDQTEVSTESLEERKKLTRAEREEA